MLKALNKVIILISSTQPHRELYISKICPTSQQQHPYYSEFAAVQIPSSTRNISLTEVHLQIKKKPSRIHNLHKIKVKVALMG